MSKVTRWAAAFMAIMVVTAAAQVQAQQVVIDNYFTDFAANNTNGTAYVNSGLPDQWTVWDDFMLDHDTTLMGASFLFRDGPVPASYTFEIRSYNSLLPGGLGAVVPGTQKVLTSENVTRTYNVLPSPDPDVDPIPPGGAVNQYDVVFDLNVGGWIDLDAGKYWVSLYGDTLRTGANIVAGGNGYLQRKSDGTITGNGLLGATNGAVPFQLIEVPEPASLALWGMAFAAVGVVGFRRRRKQRAA